MEKSIVPLGGTVILAIILPLSDFTNNALYAWSSVL